MVILFTLRDIYADFSEAKGSPLKLRGLPALRLFAPRPSPGRTGTVCADRFQAVGLSEAAFVGKLRGDAEDLQRVVDRDIAVAVDIADLKRFGS